MQVGSRPYPDDAELDRVLAHLAGKGYDIERVAGVSLGGCCDAFGTDRVGAMRPEAHAHVSAKSAMRGWICVKSGKPEKVRTASGRPTAMLIHEVAHIVTWAGHTVAWIKAVTTLGAPAEGRKYAKRNADRRARPPAIWYWTDRETGERKTGTHREMLDKNKDDDGCGSMLRWWDHWHDGEHWGERGIATCKENR